MLTEELLEQHCQPCSGIPPMTKRKAEAYLKLLHRWSLEADHIFKEYKFESYQQGLDFAHKIGLLAEEEDHHPEILIRWKKVRLALSTHSIKGLSRNDFIMAAKTDREYERLKAGTVD